MFPSAYVERWFAVDAPRPSVEAWFDAELERLGWTARDVEPPPLLRGQVHGRTYERDEGESMGLAWFGASYRLHYEVNGVWSDGTAAPRPG